MSNNKNGAEKQAPPAGAKYQLTVDGRVCYLKELNRQVLEMAFSYMGLSGQKAEIIRAGEVVLLGCWLGGDEEIKTNDSLLIAAALQAYNLVDIKEAELKKI